MGLIPKDENNPAAITFDDLSDVGACTLCINMIMRTVAMHLESNYANNPYKDIPIDKKHPIVADLTADIYEKILAKCIDCKIEDVISGKKGDTAKVDIQELLRLSMFACIQILNNPDITWFTQQGPESGESDDRAEDDMP